jgi:hypothetical protein
MVSELIVRVWFVQEDRFLKKKKKLKVFKTKNKKVVHVFSQKLYKGFALVATRRFPSSFWLGSTPKIAKVRAPNVKSCPFGKIPKKASYSDC